MITDFILGTDLRAMHILTLKNLNSNIEVSTIMVTTLILWMRLPNLSGLVTIYSHMVLSVRLTPQQFGSKACHQQSVTLHNKLSRKS